ncbi:interferon-induced protein 44 isoform X1 [Lates calcarifer]|uniref:Interferon-induced protein 44 isoform X1 n=1 Tax=Lates calcarifer TaxID=8187 RepID=A0AAJ8DNK6_LATCA|nr:interferon-induced protein 44 isoform X1 [Lates calcarifer]
MLMYVICLSALSAQPWRELPANNQDNLDFVKFYNPRKENVKHLRILLHGPAGAAKSCFINSVDSILRERSTGRALTDAISGSSFTQKYKTYKFEKNPGSFYSFVFNDVMGFEKNANRGVHVEDIKLVLKGHVTEGYKFDPEHQLTEDNPGYKTAPTVEDRVHVVVSVVSAGSVSLITEDVVRKMRDVRLAASEMGIPQLAILTKVDEACPEVKANIKNIYKSKYLKEQVEKFHLLLGIPLNCIFLVKNYDKEFKTDDDISAPILLALKQMIYYGEDYLNSL